MGAKGPIFSWLIVLVACGILMQAQAAAYTLTVTADHGSVDITPLKAQYDEGETVGLIPRPDVGYCFSHWSGDLRGSRLVGRITIDSNKSITANFRTWTSPIGIPMPEFGIFETYRMYNDPEARNPSPSYMQNADGGYYSHYVDKANLAICIRSMRGHVPSRWLTTARASTMIYREGEWKPSVPRRMT
jgi:hypothetical protein